MQILREHYQIDTLLEYFPDQDQERFLNIEKAAPILALEIEKSLGKKGYEYRMPREKCRMLSNDVSLILSNGKPPILTKNTPYYQNPDLAHLNELTEQSSSSQADSEPPKTDDGFGSTNSFFTSFLHSNIRHRRARQSLVLSRPLDS